MNVKNKKSFLKNLKFDLKRNPGLYFLVLPALVFTIIFSYLPMYGVVLAFKDYDSTLGILRSPSVGFENFDRFFQNYYFKEILWNTFSISLFSILIGFPLPVIFALMVNAVDNQRFKKIIQMVSYAPYFISIVVIVAMLTAFLEPSTGLIINFLRIFNPNASINLLNSAKAFKSLYIFSGIWQTIGWSSIIYISALSSVDVEQYEAATIDGASKLQKILHIEIPAILPTIVTLLILSMGNILSVGFEKVYLMQNADNMATSEVISTYVYKKGLLAADYGYGAAVGLFNSIINFVILVIVNMFAKKTTDYSLW